MKIFKYLTLIMLSLCGFNSCNTTEPSGNKGSAVMSLADASCTEAWLKLSSNSLSLPANVELYKNNSLNQTISLTAADTILYVDSLLPNQTYNFHSVIQPINHSPITTDQLPVTTLDTTSNDFTWQTWTFGGQAGSCTLYDVAIVNDTCIYAVGEIYLLDSTGVPDPNAYNVVKWNGTSWKVKRIKYYGSCSAVEFPPLKAIWAFSDSEIVVTNGGSIGWLNGNTVNLDCGVQPLLNGAINKIWGKSSNDFYVVGNGGSIARCLNRTWSKIESGTSLQFTDIYGATDSKTGEQQILAVCTQNYPLGQGIYRINGNTATQISSYPIQWELFGVWFVPNRHYYVEGSGIYEKRLLSDSTWRNGPLEITHYGTSGIRGNWLNDIFVSGAFGELLHFNGVSWKSYINETGLSNGGYGRVEVKNNLVVAVGLNNGQAIVLMGRRQ